MPHPDTEKDQAFINAIKNAREQARKRNGLIADQAAPRCTPKQTADYLLRFANPVKGNIKGICFYAFDNRVIVKHPTLIQHSVNQDGAFNPIGKYRQKLDYVLRQLEDKGVPIKECKQSISDAFKQNDRYLKVLFYSFNKTIPHPLGQNAGHALSISTDGSDFYFVGIDANRPNLVITLLFHEIGHVLELNHLPVNFGEFSLGCASDFYEKIEQIQAAMTKNPCAVCPEDSEACPGNRNSSVMFCADFPGDFYPKDFTLPKGDAIAFKTQYERMIEEKPKKTNQKKAQKMKPPKIELSIVVSNPSLLNSTAFLTSAAASLFSQQNVPAIAPSPPESGLKDLLILFTLALIVLFCFKKCSTKPVGQNLFRMFSNAGVTSAQNQKNHFFSIY